MLGVFWFSLNWSDHPHKPCNEKETSKVLRNSTECSFWLGTHIFTYIKKNLGLSAESRLGNQYTEIRLFFGACSPWRVSAVFGNCWLEKVLHYFWLHLHLFFLNTKTFYWCFSMLSVLLIDTLFWYVKEIFCLQLNNTEYVDMIRFCGAFTFTLILRWCKSIKETRLA